MVLLCATSASTSACADLTRSMCARCDASAARMSFPAASAACAVRDASCSRSVDAASRWLPCSSAARCAAGAAGCAVRCGGGERSVATAARASATRRVTAATEPGGGRGPGAAGTRRRKTSASARRASAEAWAMCAQHAPASAASAEASSGSRRGPAPADDAARSLRGPRRQALGSEACKARLALCAAAQTARCGAAPLFRELHRVLRLRKHVSDVHRARQLCEKLNGTTERRNEIRSPALQSRSVSPGSMQTAVQSVLAAPVRAWRRRERRRRRAGASGLWLHCGGSRCQRPPRRARALVAPCRGRLWCVWRVLTRPARLAAPSPAPRPAASRVAAGARPPRRALRRRPPLARAGRRRQGRGRPQAGLRAIKPRRPGVHGASPTPLFAPHTPDTLKRSR